MPKRLKYIALLALLIALVALFFSSFLVGSGLRLWAWWEARDQGIRIELGKITAAPLRPVLIDKIHITDPTGNLLEFETDHVAIDLDLARILFGTRGRAIRSLSMEHVRARISRAAAAVEKSRLNWSTLQRMLPGSFSIPNFEFRLEGEDSVILLHGGSISGSEIEAGRFASSELVISSPLFHQTFTHLRGATKWQDNRLVLGGIALASGLDLQTLTIDLGRLAKERADFQFDLDTFGGKIRASFADEWRPGQRLWNFAGSANDISLAQTSQALGFTDSLGGSLRACKFTFRGDPRDLMHATASIWTELASLSWRDHIADTIMLGAVFYNRQFQLQELYLKQRNNQLNLSGQGSFSTKPNEWLSPDFRGDISGLIDDLGQFAALFGARPGQFAGKVEIGGTMDTRDRRIGGHITTNGSGLSIFNTYIDEFVASFALKGSELEIEQFDLSRKHDWLHAEGRLDLGGVHNYSGSLSADLANLTDYLSILGLTSSLDSHPAPAQLQFMIDSGVWNGNATITTRDSRPVSIGVINLPIWVGETWNEFSIRPLNIILSFPLLSFDNGPRWLGLGLLRGGVLSGGIHLSGSLRTPMIDGDMQLINGKPNDRTFGLNGISGHITFAGSRGSINFLRAANDAVDVSFNGELDITAADRVVIDLTSNLPLFNFAGSIGCIDRVTLAPTTLVSGQPVGQLEFRGDLFNQSWSVTLRETAAKLLQPNGMEDRTIPLCLGSTFNQNELILGVYSPPAKAVVKKRKRARTR